MKAALVFAALLAGVVFAALFLSGPASAADTTCKPRFTSQSSGIQGNLFVATGMTKCHQVTHTPDDVGVIVFWDYVEWSFGLSAVGVWRSGGVYELGGCYSCSVYTSQTNTHVPLVPYSGINCRRAQVIHRILNYTSDQSSWWYSYPPPMTAKCQ